MIGFDEAIERATTARPRLIAIDGLPASGKSTLAHTMADALGAQCLWLDDFVLPERLWRGQVQPAFPFPYFDYAAFMSTVRTLALGETARYLSYDWQTGERASEAVVHPDGPVIIEGVSALHPDLAPLYDLRFWVESDARTTLDAALQRGVGDWADEWRDLFLPSVSIYLATDPANRADFRVAGRMA